MDASTRIHGYSVRRVIALLGVVAGLSLIVFAFTSHLNLSYAQDDEKEYIGTRECVACHRELGRSHESSRHALTLREPEEGAIVADFTQGEDVRTVKFPDEDTPRPFAAEDVAFVLGTGRHVQRYVYELDRGEYFVFPAEWNTTSQAWEPYQQAENWLDESHNFVENCAGCHTTALNPRRGKWEDTGVQCEACHGPGNLHAEVADDAGDSPSDRELREIRENIVLSPDPQICGQCHSQGTSGEHPYPTEYLPGHDLLDKDVFSLVANDDPNYWWATGHGTQSNMQFNEWLASPHAQALDVLQGAENVNDTCLSCHSGDYQLVESQRADPERAGDPPDALTLETAQYGITCNNCHTQHGTTEQDYGLVAEPYALCTQCHQDNEVTAGYHFPDKEIYEGQPLLEQVKAQPSSHFEQNLICTNCHMPSVPVGNETRVSHNNMPVLPSTDPNTPPDTCTGCHTDLTRDYMEKFVAETQTKVTDRAGAAHAALMTRTEVDSWLVDALAIVQGDSSRGLHNYAYTNALLHALEVELGTATTVVAPTTTTIEASNPADCAECHTEEYRHWEDSLHSQASLTDGFLQDFAAQGRPAFCMSCHTSGYNPNTGEYAYEGVVCSNCHTQEAGGTHPPAPIEVASDSAVCGRCHSGAHAPAYDQWLMSEHRVAGIDCVDCHNPHQDKMLQGDINTTCTGCHKDAQMDQVHMGDNMTCTDCHMRQRVIEGTTHKVIFTHTMGIDPGVCADCHGNTHVLTAQPNGKTPAEAGELDRLQTEVDRLQEESDKNLNSGLVGGALGTVVLVGMIWLVLRFRRFI